MSITPLSHTIKTLRLKSKLSQEKLAEGAGVSLPTIVKLETGKNVNPRIDSLYRIASALRVSVDELLVTSNREAGKVEVAPQQYIPLYKRDLPPFPILLLANAYTKQLEDVVRDHWKALVLTIENGFSTWHFGDADLERISQRCLHLLAQDPLFLVKLMARFERMAIGLLRKIGNFTVLPKQHPNSQKLANLFQEFCRDYEAVSAYGEIVPFSLESILTNQLKNFLKERFAGASGGELDRVFAALSAFHEPSFVAREETNLLRIALHPRSRQPALLRQHSERFNWVPFDYIGPAWDLASFQKRLREMNALGRSVIEEKLEEFTERSRALTAEQERIIRSYRLPRKVLQQFTWLRQCGLLFDRKKELLSQAHYDLSFLLRGIAKQLHVPLADLYYSLPDEVVEWLRTGRAPTKVVQGRRRSSMLVSQDGLSRFVSGAERYAWEALLQRSVSEKKMEIIKGMGANRGKVQGRANVILSPRHIGDMKKGDILVATMTTVDFVPAMRLASAIVTDIGGITCHAAIVSRELGIPCVVGTNVATKSLATGDAIAVDGDSGSVTLVKG